MSQPKPPSKEMGRIPRSFLWGLGVLLLYVLSMFVLYEKWPSLDFLSAEDMTFWKVVFGIGIALSVLSQYVVTAYFHLGKSFKTVELSTGLDYVSMVCQGLMAIPAIYAINKVGLKTPFYHLGGVIAYLAIVVFLDWLIWKKAVPKDNAGHAFKTRCGQLFCRIDLPAMVIVVFWAIVVLAWLRISPESGQYVLLRDVEQLSREVLGVKIVSVVAIGQRAHAISEPLLAGVIGFHMLMTSLLLVVHLFEWERDSPKALGQ